MSEEVKETRKKSTDAKSFDDGLDLIRAGRFEVSFERCAKLEEFQFLDLVELMRSNNTLRTLKLVGLQLTDGNAETIGEFLRENNFLKSLSLSRNNIGDKGATMISQSLVKNTSLQELSFRHNRISDKGVVSYGRMLKTNKSLTVAMFSSNKIGDEGARNLFNCLEDNVTVSMVDLSDNNITNDSVDDFVRLLQKNKALKSVFLYQTKLKKECLEPIAKALEKNNSLTYLQLPNEIEECDALRRINYLCSENNENDASKVESLVKLNKKNTFPKSTAGGLISKQLRLSSKRSEGSGLFNKQRNIEGVFGMKEERI